MFPDASEFDTTYTWLYLMAPYDTFIYLFNFCDKSAEYVALYIF